MVKRLFLLVPAVLCASVLATSAATVRVKADKTPMRAAASPTAAVVLELKAGTVLELLDAGRDWYKVREPQSKKEGFLPVSAADLLPGSPAQTAGAQKPPAAGGQKPGAAGAAPAKPPRTPKKGDWLDRGYFAANGIYEGGASAITQTQSWASFAETAAVTVENPAVNAGGVDVGGAFRVWRNLAVGAAVTVVSRSGDATVSGSMPNPLYLNRPIALDGGFGTSNSQVGFHLQVGWVVPMPPKMQLMVFGGPSIFQVKQTIVQAQGIGLSAGYPFESGAISTANTTEASETAIGFGAGADVSYFFSRTVGVGGIVRYAKASVSFPVTGQPSVETDAGGFQVGAGLRVRFGGPKPPARPKPPAAKPPQKQVPAKPEPKKK
jgi:hypothetical protein